jgi:hypothetical protein
METKFDLGLQLRQQTFSLLFDTSTELTCLNATSFHTTFHGTKPRNFRDSLAASGEKMSFLGIYGIDLYISGKQFTHPVNVINKLNDDIIGIHFMNIPKLHYDVQLRQVMISGFDSDKIVPIKELVLPARSLSILNVKYKGCPISFQCLMQLVLRSIYSCIVYIDDLLILTNNHEDHQG